MMHTHMELVLAKKLTKGCLESYLKVVTVKVIHNGAAEVHTSQSHKLRVGSSSGTKFMVKTTAPRNGNTHYCALAEALRSTLSCTDSSAYRPSPGQLTKLSSHPCADPRHPHTLFPEIGQEMRMVVVLNGCCGGSEAEPCKG